MGMYDSFYLDPSWGIDCPKCGTQPEEFQTKDLECDLVGISIDPAGRTSVRHARDHLNDLANLYCKLSRPIGVYHSCDSCRRRYRQANPGCTRTPKSPWVIMTLHFDGGRLARVSSIRWQLDGDNETSFVHRPDIYPAALDPTHQRYEVDYTITDSKTVVVEAGSYAEAEALVRKSDNACDDIDYLDRAACSACHEDMHDASKPVSYVIDREVLCGKCAFGTDNDSSTPNDGAKGAE